MTLDVSRAAAHWGEHDPDPERHFYGFPPLRAYLFECVTGRPAVEPLQRDWVERWLVEERLGDALPASRCLSICSGFGEIERILARMNAFKSCLALDVAAEAVAEAARRAEGEGLDNIEYRQADLNRAVLDAEAYELVWANGALHHLSDLEHIVGEIHRALRMGGHLVANEFVGPSWQRLNDREKELVNAAVHLIPSRLRSRTEETFVPDRFRRPRLKRALYQLTGRTIEVGDEASAPKKALAAINNGYAGAVARLRGSRFRFGQVWDTDEHFFHHIDPSEAARSEEILDVVTRTFEDVDVRYYNGSILLYALDSTFYERYDANDPRDRMILDALTGMERDLVAAGEIRPHHALIIARKS